MSPQRRHDLSDAVWAQLEPLLPPQRPTIGRPAKNRRTVINGIVWALCTGAPWRDPPERYGPWQTVYSRCRRLREAGVWERILTALQAEAAHDGELDGWLAMIDGSSIRAHQQAAGAPKRGVADQELGRSRGEWGSKLHLLTERGGKPIVWALTAGQRHESPQAISLLEHGLAQMWSDAATCADKG